MVLLLRVYQVNAWNGTAVGSVCVCVCVFYVLLAVKTAWPTYGRTECCDLLKKKSIVRVGTVCCLHRNFYPTGLCECILVVSLTKCPSSVTLSALDVTYLIKTNAWYFLALSLVGLPRLHLLSNSRRKEGLEAAGYEHFILGTPQC